MRPINTEAKPGPACSSGSSIVRFATGGLTSGGFRAVVMRTDKLRQCSEGHDPPTVRVLGDLQSIAGR